MEHDGKATISRLMGILAGKTPISHGVELIGQDVVAHMDGITFRGINTWANWIRYIQTRDRVTDLDLEVDQFVTNDDGTITATGRWKGRSQGRQIFSRDLWARYRLQDGVIVEIWTTRTNYEFMLGPFMRSRAGQFYFMLHVYFWGNDSNRLDLRVRPVPAGATQPVTSEA